MIKKITKIIIFLILFLFTIIGATALNSQWTQPYFNYEQNGQVYMPQSFEQQIYGNFDDGTATIDRSDTVGNDVNILAVIYDNTAFYFQEVGGLLLLMDNDYSTITTYNLDGGVIDKEFSIIGGDGSFLNEQTGEIVIQENNYQFCAGFDNNKSGQHWQEIICYDGNTLNLTASQKIEESTGTTCKAFNTAGDPGYCYTQMFNGSLIATDIFANTSSMIEFSASGNKSQYYAQFPAPIDPIWMPPYVMDNNNDGTMDIYIHAGFEEMVMFKNTAGILSFNNFLGGSGVKSLDSGSFGLNAPIIFLESDGITATREFVYLNDDDIAVYNANGVERWRITLSSIAGGFDTACAQARDKQIGISDLDIDSTTEDIIIVCVASGGGSTAEAVIDGKSGIVLENTFVGDNLPWSEEGTRYPLSMIDGDNDGINDEVLTNRGLISLDMDSSDAQIWLNVDDDFTRAQAIDVTGDNIVELIFTKSNNRTTYGTNITNSLPVITTFSGSPATPICADSTLIFSMTVQDTDGDSVNCGIDGQGNGTIKWSAFEKNPLTDTTQIIVSYYYGIDQENKQYDIVIYCSDTAHPFSTQVQISPLKYTIVNENSTLCYDDGEGSLLVNNQSAVFDGSPNIVTGDAVLEAFGFNNSFGRAVFVLFIFVALMFGLTKIKAHPMAHVIITLLVLVIMGYYEILPSWILWVVGIIIAMIGALFFTQFLTVGKNSGGI